MFIIDKLFIFIFVNKLFIFIEVLIIRFSLFKRLYFNIFINIFFKVSI